MSELEHLRPLPWYTRRDLWYWAGLYGSALVLVALVSSLGPLEAFSITGFNLGEPAPRDLVVSRELTYVDREATQARIEAARRLVRPVYRVRESSSQLILERWDLVSGLLSHGQLSRRPPQVVYLELETHVPGAFETDLVQALLRQRDLSRLLDQGRFLLNGFLARGLVSPLEGASLENGLEILRQQGDSTYRQIWDGAQVITLNNLNRHIQEGLTYLDAQASYAGLLTRLIRALVEETAFLDRLETQKNLERITWETPPVRRRLQEGEWIVRQGYQVTSEVLNKIEALQASAQKMTLTQGLSFLGFLTALLVLALFLTAMGAVQPLREPAYAVTAGLLWLLHLALVLFWPVFLPGPWFPYPVVLPTLLFVAVITLLSDEVSGLLFSVSLSLPLLFLWPDRGLMVAALTLAGLLTPFALKNLEKRLDLLRAGLWLALLSAPLLGLASIGEQSDWTRAGLTALGASLNGLLTGLLTVGILPLLEHLLNSPTRFRLTELADLHTPSLRRMLSLAPGTYAHSINVAHLSELACRAIGADALLARVGAYYHDLGKTEQPEYFVENQKGVNKHDTMKPIMSATILKSHVKIGVEKAKALGLPQKIIDIITQHHGAGLIEYFFSKAQREAPDGRVSREDFCYPGPNPQFRESAVVMLADGVEAASRTLVKPSLAKLDRFVWDMIQKRYTEGLLHDSGLTFSDLDKIKNALVQGLAGQYHSRIDYPGAPAAKISSSPEAPPPDEERPPRFSPPPGEVPDG